MHWQSQGSLLWKHSIKLIKIYYKNVDQTLALNANVLMLTLQMLPQVLKATMIF